MRLSWNGLTWSALKKVGDTVQNCTSYFNGTDAYAVSTSRIINLDAADPSFKFSWWGNFYGGGTFFSQNISSGAANKEFQLYTFASLIIVLGGKMTTILDSTTLNANAGYGLLEVEYNHSLAEIYVRKDGVLLSTTTSIVISAAREPTAKFKYMARSDGSIDSVGFLKAGYMGDVTIEHNSNIVDLPMNECALNVGGSITYIDMGAGGYDATGYSVFVEGNRGTVIAFFGASILNNTFGSTQAVESRASATAAGISEDVVIYDAAVSGDDVADYLSRINGVIEDLSRYENVIVLVHGPGNNVSDTRPYATASAAGLSEIEDGMNTIVDKILAAGFDCALSNITYRSYTAPDVPPESNGSLPYNTNIIEPIIQAKCPNVWDSGLAEPFFNLYDLFKDNPSYISGDGIHPTEEGEAALRDYVFNKMYTKYPTLREEIALFSGGLLQGDGILRNSTILGVK